MTLLWKQTLEHMSFTPLEGDVNTDVLIIGGGMAGVLCTYLLHHAGVPYMLAEVEQCAAALQKTPPPRLPPSTG